MQGRSPPRSFCEFASERSDLEHAFSVPFPNVCNSRTGSQRRITGTGREAATEKTAGVRTYTSASSWSELDGGAGAKRPRRRCEDAKQVSFAPDRIRVLPCKLPPLRFGRGNRAGTPEKSPVAFELLYGGHLVSVPIWRRQFVLCACASFAISGLPRLDRDDIVSPFFSQEDILLAGRRA